MVASVGMALQLEVCADTAVFQTHHRDQVCTAHMNIVLLFADRVSAQHADKAHTSGLKWEPRVA